MSDDPAPRITAALAAYQRTKAIYGEAWWSVHRGALLALVSAVDAELPALLARLATLEIIARRVRPTFLCEDEVEDIAALRSADTDIQCLAGYIRDQDIEIERCHEREAGQAARLAAAEAFISAYKTLQAAQYKSNDYYAATATLEAAEVVYDALAGTGGQG